MLKVKDLAMGYTDTILKLQPLYVYNGESFCLKVFSEAMEKEIKVKMRYRSEYGISLLYMPLTIMSTSCTQKDKVLKCQNDAEVDEDCQISTTPEVTCVPNTPPKVTSVTESQEADNYVIPATPQKSCMKSVAFDWDSKYTRRSVGHTCACMYIC